MRRPEVEFVRAADGAYLAYHSFGAGPVEILWQADTFAMVDQLWDSPPFRAWHEGLSEFARVTVFDKRGLGLSSRDVPLGDLDTQVDDMLAVLNAQEINRVVLGGFYEAGGPNALFAALHPGRVQALVWVGPTPRTTASEDYPWGMDKAQVDHDLEMTGRWGTSAWAREFIDLYGDDMRGVWASDDFARFLASAARRTCTPDVARKLSLLWNATDVRGILPTIQSDTLLVTSQDADHVAVAQAVAAVMPSAEVVSFPVLLDEIGNFGPIHAAIRRFIGAAPPLVGLTSTLASIVFTDIVNSTRSQASVGDRAWSSVIQSHDAIVRLALARWRGREIDTAGDGFYATFDGPSRAVRCALEIVSGVRDLGIEVRAGVHTGECEEVDGKFQGIAVTTGARICSLASASQVLVSQTVKDLVAGSGLTFQGAGEYELKGLPDSWRLYDAIG
jgi:class 3 adenylate cyclase/pimeloyl-ACP methyl ester carboxylesterase